MIRINQITGGRFGNRVLQYNNLMQVAHSLGRDASCSGWEGHVLFEGLVEDVPSTKPQVTLRWSDLLEPAKVKLLPHTNEYVLDNVCLHNIFYQTTEEDPRRFIKIKEEHKQQLPDDNMNVGIHIRGDDIIEADGNNGREKHSPKYYRDAIDIVESEFENIIYYVCTDDRNFDTYIQTIKYLEERGYDYKLGDVGNLFYDFALLSECDILIASSSTFVISAAIIGKENKKIIHAMEWMEKTLPGDKYFSWGNYTDDYPESYWKAFDNFWVHLYNGGNSYYRAWKFV